jgi:voltage-gated potassium channel
VGPKAGKKSSRRTDRRTAARVPRTSPVFFTSGRIEGQGRLADLSSTGARIEDATADIKPGAPITLTLELSQEGFRFEVKGRVARETPGGFAVEFHLDPDPSVEALMRWILARPGRLAPTEHKRSRPVPVSEQKTVRKKRNAKHRPKSDPAPPAREEVELPPPEPLDLQVSEPGGAGLHDPAELELPESEESVSLDVEPEPLQTVDVGSTDDAPVLRVRRKGEGRPEPTPSRRAPDRARPDRGPHAADPAPRRPALTERPSEEEGAPSRRPRAEPPASTDTERIVVRTGPPVTIPAPRTGHGSKGPRESVPRVAAQVIHRVLEGPADESVPAFVQAGIGVLILMNVAAVALATVEPLGARYAAPLHWLRTFSLGLFIVEYAARLFACTEDSRYRAAVSGRMRWALGPVALADLAAIAPVLVPGLGLDLRSLRALRLFPLFGRSMPDRWASAASRLITVLKDRVPDLTLLLLGMAILVVPTSTALYLAEHAAQPDVFTSIPQAAWWVVVTLTTVGDGYVSPVTPLGQTIGALVAVLGVGMLAVAAGILASGFVRRSGTDSPGCPRCGTGSGSEISRDA